MNDRRFFLKMLAGSTAAVCAAHLAGCGSSGPTVPATVAAGNVGDLPVGTLKAVGGAPVAIARDDQGLYAMTLVCTHAQCDISTEGSITPSLITCACHGSEFDNDGNVVRGPASAPLEHFEVTVDASGEVTIHGDTTVAQDTRVAVASAA